MSSIWLINGAFPASLGLATPKVSYTSMQADTLTVDHLTAAWDADPIFAYGEQIVVKKDGIVVFVGKVRTFPRFAGPSAESTSYNIMGPWDWLERRALLQNQAVYPPTGIGPPALVPQGFNILNQGDAGNSVMVSDALRAIVNQARSVGVPILLGDVVGFDFYVAWDEVADLSQADGITRLLAGTPDAVVHWDYTTTTDGNLTPTIHIVRTANLEMVTLPIAPAATPISTFNNGTYAEFETIRLTSRPDMVPPGAFVTYRRVNTVAGQGFLQLENRTAGVGAPSDENALVRTVNLAGSSADVIEQECVTAIIPVSLGIVLTPADGTDFSHIVQFLGRSNKWLLDADTVVTKLTPSTKFRWALAPNETTGAMEEVDLDHSLVREMVIGGITPWMMGTGLNIRGQEQEVSYEVEAFRTVNGVFGIYNSTVSRGFMATNAITRTYQYSESTAAGEPTPEGLVDALYAAMSVLRHEGTFTLKERDCTLAVRPGKAVNFSGGRPEWTTMKAIVQSASADPTTGTTQVSLGWPRQLTAADMASIYRLNRLKRPAERGLIRATGKY